MLVDRVYLKEYIFLEMPFLVKKISALLIASILLFFGFIFASHANQALAHTLSGNVSDSAGADISGATVDVIDTVTSNNVGSTTTDVSGNYSLSVNSGTYNVQVTPPSGSGFGSAISPNRTISNNTVINFILVPLVSATLSGHVYDTLGNSVSNQQVFFQSGSQIVGSKSFTNALGEYLLQVNAGTYDLHISGNGGSNSSAVPNGYQLIVHGYSHSQSTVLDITIPAKRVDIHVQNTAGNPIPNVKLTTNNPTSSNLLLGGGLIADYGDSVYSSAFSNVTTNTSGDATLWLFPATFNITATPPSGSGYAAFLLSNTNVSSDTSLTIIMQSLVTLSGHVYDAQGNPVFNQQVFFQVGGTIIGNKSFTDSQGNYFLQVSPGTYDLHLSGNGGSDGSAVPLGYQLISSNYSINQNTVLDITIPAKRVDIHVQNSSGNAISNVKLTTNNPASSNLPLSTNLIANYGDSVYPNPGVTTNASGNATLWLFPATFDITATPPSGSGYATQVLSNTTISNGILLTVILQSPATLSGHVYDAQGAPVSNQQVFFQLGGQIVGEKSFTNTLGEYSIQVNSGTYDLHVSGNGGSNSSAVPNGYQLIVHGYSHSQSTVLNVTIPAKKIDIHVQNQSGSPIPNVKLTTNNPASSSLPLGGGIIADYGDSVYSSAFSNITTDVSGNATLWLFPATFNITVTPPSEGPYLPFILNNVGVTSNQTLIISLQLKNQPPVINTIPGATINEGETYSESGSFSDPTSTSWTGTVNYGDGSGVQALTLSGTNFSLNHLYKDNGIYTITVSVTDNQGAIGTETATITVSNVVPAVGPITAPTDPVQVNTAVTAAASFTDLGVLDTHTAVWDWGDGITSGTVTENNGSGTVSDNHTYTSAGVYTIALTVTDKDGGVGSSTFQYVVVYDPSAGFVTGAGTITSPPGAYAQDSSFSGKAVFGFVSKYQNGANQPTGSTQFRFIIANFSFKSTSYDWLVVGGAKAQYKGSGTINGTGDYGFILSSIDGQLPGGGGTDKFRIKITDKTTGDIIYDNQLGTSDTSDPTTAIDSGSITIHK